MERRRFNIKIVASQWTRSLLLEAWETLAETFDIELLVLVSQGHPSISTSLKVKLFSEDQSMPGFIRDLDSHLVGADLVVAVDFSHLTSFQALRFSRKAGIPCIYVSHELTPFAYEKQLNLKAIRYDALTNASGFIVSSLRTQKILRSENVDISKICRVDTFAKPASLFSLQKRAKFRKYVGFSEDCQVITARTSFGSVDGASEILKGFRLFLNTVEKSYRSRMKLLLVGLGDQLQQLKYVASDLGIGINTVFLAQDPNDFWQDLCCASDGIIFDFHRMIGEPEQYPFDVIDALRTSAPLVVKSGTIFDDVTAGSENVLKISHFDAVEIAESLDGVFKLIQSNNGLRGDFKLSRLIATPEEVGVAMRDMLLKSISQTNAINHEAEAINFTLSVKDVITFADCAHIEVKLEEFLLFDSLTRETKSELLRIKGEILSLKGEKDRSLKSLEEALLLNSKNFKALRALGYVSWSAHSHEEAASFFKKSLAIAPNDYQSLLGMGLVYRRVKLLSESVRWLSRAIDIGGPSSNATNLLIQACVESAESKIALDALEALRESYGDLPQLMRGLGQVYLAHGLHEEYSTLVKESDAS